MGTQTAITETMGSLELAPNEHQALIAISDERGLTDEQFALALRIARAPEPIPDPADADDVRKVIGALASTLKAARTSAEQGRLQLGLYRKVLTGQPRAALAYAGDRAIRDFEWMPTPSELLKLCKEWSNPLKRAQIRARYLVRMRGQRKFNERCRLLDRRAFPADQLHTLTDTEIRHGIIRKAILQEANGAVIPWTLEDETRILAEKRDALGIKDERDNRAEDANGKA